MKRLDPSVIHIYKQHIFNLFSVDMGLIAETTHSNNTRILIQYKAYILKKIMLIVLKAYDKTIISIHWR